MQESPLLEIENLFLNNFHFKTTIIRFAGLFGYNRKPGNFFKDGKIIPDPKGFVNMIHQDDFQYIRKLLYKNMDQPAVGFPMHQIFTPDRYCMKTIKCLALNKKKFPSIKLNGGGDLCLATLNGELLSVNNLPNLNIPIFQYDSMFRTKKIISEDRARFARAWHRHFNNYENISFNYSRSNFFNG